MEKDNTMFSVKGELIDEIRYADGKIEIRKDHNLVVNSIINLITALLKGESSYSRLSYWAVGQGDKNKTTIFKNIKLTNEIGRVQILPSDIKYLDSSNNYSENPTNILEISHLFGTGDCNGTWREFGIFGGNATSTKDSGIMIDKINHKILTKTDLMEVKRTLKITFNIIR